MEQFYFSYADSAFGSAILAAVSIDCDALEKIDRLRINRCEISSPDVENAKEYNSTYDVDPGDAWLLGDYDIKCEIEK